MTFALYCVFCFFIGLIVGAMLMRVATTRTKPKPRDSRCPPLPLDGIKWVPDGFGERNYILGYSLYGVTIANSPNTADYYDRKRLDWRQFGELHPEIQPEIEVYLKAKAELDRAKREAEA